MKDKTIKELEEDNLVLVTGKADLEAKIASYLQQEEEDEDDPTPWCSHCGSMTIKGCDCGPIAENH